MKEKFEPFKELLKALREIKYAIGGKNSGNGEGNGEGNGNGNDIILPKYIFANCRDENTNEYVWKIFEIDYDGKIIDVMKIIELGELGDPGSLSEEEMTNLIQVMQNYAVNPINSDFTKRLNLEYPQVYLYTKEQTDMINKNSIIQLYYGPITKLDDSVVVDALDIFGGEANMLEGLIDISDYAQRGQYYCIILKAMYDHYSNLEVIPGTTEQPGGGVPLH